MNNRVKNILLVVLALSICLIASLVETRLHPLRRLVDDRLYDNWNHYLPCAKLPPVETVEKALQEQAITVGEIEAVHPGLIGVEVDTGKCSGRADILIWYASHQDRLAIENILGGRTFFGIPVRLVNR